VKALGQRGTHDERGEAGLVAAGEEDASRTVQKTRRRRIHRLFPAEAEDKGVRGSKRAKFRPLALPSSLWIAARQWNHRNTGADRSAGEPDEPLLDGTWPFPTADND
jgi:hypothetical protein